MRLSLRQQAMRLAIWMFALVLIVRALSMDPPALPAALLILGGALGYEALFAYMRKQASLV